MNSYISKDINLSHCKIIVFSENIAKDGISKEIYTLINDIELRPDTFVIISKTKAKEYIENSKPDLESSVSQYYEITKKSNLYTGFTDYLTIGNFYNCLCSDCCDPFAILGGVNTGKSSDNSNSENDLSIKANETPFENSPSSENIGMAVFKNDRLVGELNAIESICHLIVTNKFESTTISIKNPLNNNSTIDLYIYDPRKTKINVDIVNGSPYVNVDCCLKARVVSIDKISLDNSNDEETIKIISDAASSYFKYYISNYLYKISKEYESDIARLGRETIKNFSTNDKWKNYNWLNNYKNCFFNVDVNVNVKSGLILTES